MDTSARPRRISHRAQFLSYDAGTFFITICTRERKHFFGEIIDGVMELSDIGRFVTSQLEDACRLADGVDIPLFVVMPNHIHAVICIDDSVADNPASERNPNPAQRLCVNENRHIPLLSRYINSLKGAVTRYANRHGHEFGWQPNYHDRAIRRNSDARNIDRYIKENIDRWSTDIYNTPK